jgi:hypothetical protein
VTRKRATAAGTAPARKAPSRASSAKRAPADSGKVVRLRASNRCAGGRPLFTDELCRHCAIDDTVDACPALHVADQLDADPDAGD